MAKSTKTMPSAWGSNSSDDNPKLSIDLLALRTELEKFGRTRVQQELQRFAQRIEGAVGELSRRIDQRFDALTEADPPPQSSSSDRLVVPTNPQLRRLSPPQLRFSDMVGAQDAVRPTMQDTSSAADAPRRAFGNSYQSVESKRLDNSVDWLGPRRGNSGSQSLDPPSPRRCGNSGNQSNDISPRRAAGNSKESTMVLRRKSVYVKTKAARPGTQDARDKRRAGSKPWNIQEMEDRRITSKTNIRSLYVDIPVEEEPLQDLWSQSPSPSGRTTPGRISQVSRPLLCRVPEEEDDSGEDCCRHDGEETEWKFENEECGCELTTLREDPTKEQSRESCVSKFVQSEYFDFTMGGLILMNALLIGYQADYAARHWTEKVPGPMEEFNHFFNWVFFAELLARCVVYGSTFSMYVCNNLFDTLIVFLGVFDEVTSLCKRFGKSSFELSDQFSSVSVLRMSRVLRLLRIFRMARLLKLIGSHLQTLRIMVASILDSLTALFWALLLVMVLTYTFAVYFTQRVTEFKLDNRHSVEEGEAQVLMQYYGNVAETMAALYEGMLSGMSWREMVLPLTAHTSVIDAVLVILYMTFAILALMNVVTAIFVSAAMRHGEDEGKMLLAQQMRAFFMEADADGSGSITWKEFSAHLNNPIVSSFFKEVDMHTEQAESLFRLLSDDTGGAVGVEDLVSQCLRLHGSAKSIDLTSLIRASERHWKDIEVHNDYVRRSLTEMQLALGLRVVAYDDEANGVVWNSANED